MSKRRVFVCILQLQGASRLYQGGCYLMDQFLNEILQGIIFNELREISCWFFFCYRIKYSKINYFTLNFAHLHAVALQEPCLRTVFHLEKDFVHDNDGLLPEVRSAGGREGEHVVGEVAGKIWCHETTQTAECQTGVVEIGRGDVLSDHVGCQHDDVQTFVEALGGRKVACSLGRGGGGGGGGGGGRRRGEGAESNMKRRGSKGRDSNRRQKMHNTLNHATILSQHTVCMLHADIPCCFE